MAEALLRAGLAERGCDGVDVSSAGTWANTGNPATDGALEALRGRGVDGSAHRSRPLERAEVERADLIVAMTSVHRREVLDLYPDAAPKLVLMNELAEIQTAADGADLERLLTGVRPEWRRALDLDDPYGLGWSAYDRTLRAIEAGVDVLADLICRSEPAAR